MTTPHDGPVTAVATIQAREVQPGDVLNGIGTNLLGGLFTVRFAHAYGDTVVFMESINGTSMTATGHTEFLLVGHVDLPPEPTPPTVEEILADPRKLESFSPANPPPELPATVPSATS